MENKFRILTFLLIISCSGATAQENSRQDSLLERSINKALVANTPHFLADNKESGIFLVKIKLLDTSGKVEISLLNDNRKECAQYFDRTLSTISFKKYFFSERTIILPVFFYNISEDFENTSSNKESTGSSKVNNSVFDITPDGEKTVQNIVFLRPVKIHFGSVVGQKNK